MTSIVSVAELTKPIGKFSDMMTAGMKRSVRRHFKEYLLGIMLPSDFRRKSVSNISSLVSEYDQSTVNRALHGIDSKLLEQNYIRFLKTIIVNHRVMFIGDDTMLEHPGSKVMEYVGWFFDHASGNNVLAHQPVTSGLYDLDTDTFYPFLTRLYVKRAQSEKEFKTKLEIMEDIFSIAENNFNVSGKVVDSWYSSVKFLGNNYVTELKANRKASFYNLGRMTIKNRDLFYTMDEIIESTFIMHERDSGTLKEFPLQREFTVYLSNGEPINLMVLYNPENKRKKFIASDYLSGEEMINAWSIRWSIENFHKDAKALGLGEYQVRDSEGSLIHARITIAAYTLLSIMTRSSMKLFGRILKTIGECSRAIKEILIIKKNYKSRLFSG
jgi:hypothetical protein